MSILKPTTNLQDLEALEYMAEVILHNAEKAELSFIAYMAKLLVDAIKEEKVGQFVPPTLWRKA